MESSYPHRFPLDINWQRHHGGPERPLKTRLHATIGPKRRILLNANLYRLIGSPTEVLLYFNSKVSKIAIETVEPGTSGAFPVINRRGSYEIPAAAFCRTNEIRIRATHKFINPKPTNQGRLFLDLKRTAIVSRRRKKALTKAAGHDYNGTKPMYNCSASSPASSEDKPLLYLNSVSVYA